MWPNTSHTKTQQKNEKKLVDSIRWDHFSVIYYDIRVIGLFFTTLKIKNLTMAGLIICSSWINKNLTENIWQAF